MLQKKKKLSARTISKQCGLASAHGARGRKRAQRVNNSGFAETPSLPSSRTVCVCLCVFEVQKSIADYPSLSPFSLSPSPATVASSSKLALCSMDAQR